MARGKAGSIIWSLILSVGVIVFLGSVMMPSTKRSRLDVRDLQRIEEEERRQEEAARAAMTKPATSPSIGPTSRPAGEEKDAAAENQ